MHYVCVFFCVIVLSCALCNLGAALGALMEPCMSRSLSVHCYFWLHFYERINGNDHDDDDENSESAPILRYITETKGNRTIVTIEHQ